jgi:hypothetical protein
VAVNGDEDDRLRVPHERDLHTRGA